MQRFPKSKSGLHTVNAPSGHSFKNIVFLSLVITLLPSFAYAACPSAASDIFSVIFCQFNETIITIKNKILDKLYDKMSGIAPLLASTYIIFYGIEIMIGAATFSPRDSLGRLAKVMVVYSLMVGGHVINMNTVYDFFISLALEVPSYFLHGFAGAGILEMNGSGTDLITNMYATIDRTFSGIMGGHTGGTLGISADKIIGFVAAMYLVPGLASLASAAMQLILQIFLLIAQSLVNVLLGLATIGFLVGLGPMFIGFYLFEQTKFLADGWIKNLASYSLQIIFILAALAIWIAAVQPYQGFFGDLNSRISPWSHVIRSDGSRSTSVSTWVVCTKKTGGSCSDVVPVTALAEKAPEFISWALYNIGALLCLTYGFGALLKQAPFLAQAITNAGGAAGGLDGAGLSDLVKGGGGKVLRQERAQERAAGSSTGIDLKKVPIKNQTSQALAEKISEMASPRSKK